MCFIKKKDSSLKNIICFFPFCAGCEASEYSFVFINDDHLSAVGKWTTEERVRRGGGEKEKYERRKQFETVAVADRRGRMGLEKGKLYLVAFHRRRRAG